MTPRKWLDRTTILLTAAALAEEVTLDRLTLNQLAARLGVKTPSLYNHVQGLPDVFAGLAALGVQRLGAVIANAAIGRSHEDAIMAIAWEYRTFARTHPELYKAIVKSPEMEYSEITEAESEIVRILLKVLEPYDYSEEEAFHRIRCFRSFLHGFVSLEAAGFFRAPWDVDRSYEETIASVLVTMRPDREGVKW